MTSSRSRISEECSYEGGTVSVKRRPGSSFHPNAPTSVEIDGAVFVRGSRLKAKITMEDDLTDHGMGVNVMANAGDILTILSFSRNPETPDRFFVKHSVYPDRAFTCKASEVELLQGTQEQIDSFEVWAKERGINLTLAQNVSNRYAFAVADHSFASWIDSPGFKEKQQ